MMEFCEKLLGQNGLKTVFCLTTFRDIGIKIWVLVLVSVLSFLEFFSSMARAQGLGSVGQNLTDNVTNLAKAVVVCSGLIGLIMVAAGLTEFYNLSQRGNGTLKGGVTKCTIGVCLLGLAASIRIFSSTLFGTNESATGLGLLGQ